MNLETCRLDVQVIPQQFERQDRTGCTVSIKKLESSCQYFCSHCYESIEYVDAVSQS